MMKITNDRYEIAKLLNFNKYPVLNLDLAKDKIINSDNIFRGCYEGQKVRFEYFTHNGEKQLWHGNLAYFYDSGLCVLSDSAVITKDFGYHDIEKDLEKANAPIIRENSECVVVIHDSEKRLAMVCLTTIKSINRFCMTAYQFESDFDDIIHQLEKAVG